MVATKKQSDELPKIVVIRTAALSMQICSSIPPEEKHTINDALKELGLNISGTSGGWVLDESIDPVECEDYEDRWHYILTC